MPRRLPIVIAALATIGLSAGPAHAADYLGQIGAPGAPGPSQLEHPWAVTTADDGRVYVTDMGTHRVSVFDSGGAPLLQFGSLIEPSGIAVDGGQVVVTDRATGHVRRFSSFNGTALADVGGGPGTGAGQFQLPTSVALGTGHELIVASKGRIARFNGAGGYEQQRLATTSGPGQLKGLSAVTVRPDGAIYASDTVDDKIERYAPTLAFGQAWFGLTAPTGLDFDPQGGVLWVADRIKGVRSFTSTGSPTATLAASGPGALSDPTGVAVDCRGTLYVTDQLAGRVQKYGSPATATAGNLLVNGSFDQGGGSCSGLRADRGAGPGWSDDGSTSAVHYGAAGGFPGRGVGDSRGGGESLLAGGSKPEAVAEQDVDVSAQALDIDDGRRAVTLSGLLGGKGTDGDAATVTATALDAAGAPVGTLTIGPVTAADRANVTTLLPRTATTTLPTGTRKVRVRVTARLAAGGDTVNDGYADNLALTLTPQKPAPAAPAQNGATPTTPAPAATPPKSAPRANVTISLVNAAFLRKTHRLTVRVNCDAACSTLVSARVAGHLLTGRATKRHAGATRVNWTLTKHDAAQLAAQRKPTVRVQVTGGRKVVRDTFAVS